MGRFHEALNCTRFRKHPGDTMERLAQCKPYACSRPRMADMSRPGLPDSVYHDRRFIPLVARGTPPPKSEPTNQRDERHPKTSAGSRGRRHLRGLLCVRHFAVSRDQPVFPKH